MAIFHTESGSQYEVDDEAKRVRRLIRSAASESARPGSGEWVPYQAIEFPPNGSLWIQWGWRDGLFRTTMTSRIVRKETREEAQVE